MANHIKDYVSNTTIDLYHAQTMPFEQEGIAHFALVDSLMNEVGRTQKKMLHFWPTKKLVFLGMQDTKLPYFEDGLDVLEQAGYDYVVRNSGGLGVVSDQGILNVSLIIPNKDLADITIDDGYEIMYSLVQDVIDAPIEAIEIPDSYCPGDFDLSIEERKISGISQRRRAGALAIMLYLSVTGDQDKRGKMMRDFYDQGLKGEESNWHYPDVNPDIMVNIDEVTGQSMSVQDLEESFVNSLESFGAQVQDGEYSQEIVQDFEKERQSMVSRNQRMLGDRFQENEG